MGEEEVVNVIPIEETIIDPLYEPLKLNRYELCEHLQRLKDISHLRHGFSPYLLFDVEGMKEIVEEIKKDRILDSEQQFLTSYNLFFQKIGEYLDILESGPREEDLRNIYYWRLKSKRDGILREIEGIKDKYREILNSFLIKNSQEFLNFICVSTKKEIKKDNIEKISHHLCLDYPVKVTCPICKKKQFMCEEGKIYSMKEALLRTFELRRAKWLQMSGSLHTVHRASTHTRLSHEIGSMIAGVNALREIDVYPVGDMSMSLGEYLLMRGELHEFLIANFLHDIGHSPLSHVMEPNPFIKLDHEEITRNLIRGEKVKGDGGDEMDWYVAERYLLKMKAIRDFEHRFLENRYDSIYDVGGEEGCNEEDRKREFLDCLEENGEILESEVVTVSEVLENFGVNKDRVVEILSGKIFCPKKKCGRLLKIKDGDVEACKDCGAAEIEREKIYDTQFLNKLIESEIDIDRMDHVKRDSVVCGLSLTSFRLLELLGSMSVVLPASDAYKEIHNTENNKPCILISENGLLYVMDLLNARKSVFNDVLYSDANNWINGVVNQITALAVISLPHITNILPFITDQILMHLYTNDLFLGTQIEKLNRLFHGKMDCSGYGKPMRYKLKDGVIVTEKKLRDIYRRIEKINDDYEYLELPAVVFYTNIKFAPIECGMEGCGGKLEDKGSGVYKCNLCGRLMAREAKKWKKTQAEKDKKKRSWDDILVYEKKIATKEGEKFFKFIDLVENEENPYKYRNTSREVFPAKPNELDVKNLLYVWVSDFVVRSDESSGRNKGAKSKNEWRDYIKKAIGGVWSDKDKIRKFENKFVDLDNIAEVKMP